MKAKACNIAKNSLLLHVIYTLSPYKKTIII